MELPAKVTAMLAQLLEAAGAVAPAVRRAAVDRAAGAAAELPAALAAFVDRVAHHAVDVGETDLAALRQAGWDDEQIFDVTLSAAVGASLGRYRRALALLDEA